MDDLRVFLADDHAVVREGLKSLIKAQSGMQVVGEAGDGRSACHEAVKLGPDVAVIDVSMPELNGIETTRRLKKLCSNVKVLALSMHEDVAYLSEMMQAGASGYILKRAAPQELIHALTTVASGGTYLDQALAEKVIAKSMNIVPAETGKTVLSAREAEIVRLVAEGHSNKEIAAQLHISEKSVETYRSRSTAKLGLCGRADFVRYALRQGWLKSS